MEQLQAEIDRYKANPKRYMQLYPVSGRVIKEYLSKKDSGDEPKTHRRSVKQAKR